MTPIRVCRLFRAANGDESEYFSVLKEVRDNLRRHKKWSTWPCECEPRCDVPTAERWDRLHERLATDLGAERLDVGSSWK